ncbi:sugar transferase [candidate division KSB1 bacterium]
MIKRLFDLFLSFGALIVLAPVLIILFPFVKIDSSGPFFFRQNRMGKKGRLFRIYKIRTMFIDPLTSKGEGTVKKSGITSMDDPRVTRIGKFLRKSKIDELPQIINVFLGQMSFVGPRPELPEYKDVNPEFWNTILSVRPGITAETSLLFINEEELIPADKTADEVYRSEILPKKQKMDLEYVKNRSFFKDISIILRTLFSLFKTAKNRSDPVFLQNKDMSK